MNLDLGVVDSHQMPPHSGQASAVSRPEISDIWSEAPDPWLETIGAIPNLGLGRVIYAAAVKRTVDVIIAALLLVLLSPLLILVAACVRIDSPGPSIFAQERVGRQGRHFTLYKFRTMTHNPSEEIAWFF